MNNKYFRKQKSFLFFVFILLGLFVFSPTSKAAFITEPAEQPPVVYIEVPAECPTSDCPEVVCSEIQCPEPACPEIDYPASACAGLSAGELDWAQRMTESPQASAQAQPFSETWETETFKAKVIEILAEEEKPREDGSVYKQQNLLLRAYNGPQKGKEFTYYGISDIEVGNASIHRVGDRVYVDVFQGDDGEISVYIVDTVRTWPIIVLTLIFIFTVILIGRFKGVRALISLLLSFVIIIKFILPQILSGRDPFLVTLIGGLLIMAIIIYLTEGWQRKSHLAILAVFISLAITLLLSLIFTAWTNLSGLSQEEAIFLIGIGEAEINFRGLLLAGMIIGAIGVLDDIIVGQIEAVDRIREANPKLPRRKIFSLAYKIGNTHLGAIINTLFLTYAGAALPLLLLFVLNQSGDLSFDRALNTEAVTTEIVRTLVGSIGVMASMPIATFLAAWSLNKKEAMDENA